MTEDTNIDYSIDSWAKLVECPKLGEILLHESKIDIAQLGMALDIQKIKKIPIGEIFIQMGVVTEEELLIFLELQLNIKKKLSDNLE